MNLQEFITETLVQLARGIEEAERQLSASTGIVNPRYVVPDKGQRVYGFMVSADEKGRQRYRAVVQKVEFDVAVYAAESKGTKGGIGLMVVLLV